MLSDLHLGSSRTSEWCTWTSYSASWQTSGRIWRKWYFFLVCKTDLWMWWYQSTQSASKNVVAAVLLRRCLLAVNIFPSLQEFASMDELLRKMPMYQVCSGLLRKKSQKSVATCIAHNIYLHCKSQVILILRSLDESNLDVMQL